MPSPNASTIPSSPAPIHPSPSTASFNKSSETTKRRRVGTPAETGQQPTDASKTLPYLASAIQKLKSHIADKDPDNDYLWPVHLATHIIAATQHSQENNVNPTDTSFLLNHVGILYLNLAKYAQAEPLLLRALQINEATMGPNHPEVATILHNLAALLKSTNRFDDAEHLMRRAIMINESFFWPQTILWLLPH